LPIEVFARNGFNAPEEHGSCRLSRRGLHCEALDEDISIAGLFARYRDQTTVIPAAAG
jgi:hypothetical protein